MVNLRLSAVALAVWLASHSGALFASSQTDDELALAYGDQPVVSIATGREQQLSEAPATATVITEQDFRSLGATTLEEALESVPGMHVGTSSLAGNPIYSIRGIYTHYNPQVLMLVNGLPITNAFFDNRSNAWGGFPLTDVKRIEVIRGPGSALYGADAFAGVINVITRTADDIKGNEAGVRFGSFHTRDGWALSKLENAGWKAAFYVESLTTQGDRRQVNADFQSALDTVFKTHVSNAPGPVNAFNRAFDSRLDLSREHWRVRAAYQSRDVGIGEGLAEALDPVSKVPESRDYADVTYTNPDFAHDLQLTAAAGLYDIRELPADPGFVLFPPGATFYDSSGNKYVFPTGVIGNPAHFERHTLFNGALDFVGIAGHKIRAGVGFQDDNLYKTEEYKNFVQSSANPLPQPLGSLVDVSGTPAVFLTPHRRDLTYQLLQDEWTIANDWTLTAGVRHDYYSNFGNTTNPRLALVWNPAYNVVVKAMHGSAFRAPSVAEEYNINNPVAIGNPHLKPEQIATDELSASWQVNDALHGGVTLFRYRWSDMIVFEPEASAGGDRAENMGKQFGHGVEFEGAWAVRPGLQLSGNYSFQHSVDQTSHQDAGLAPHRHAFGKLDWQPLPLWHVASTVNWVSGRDRQPGDTRPRLKDYTLVNLSLTKEKLYRDVEFRLVVQNLFNRDAREPDFLPGNVREDLPLPGQALYGQVQLAF